tara:strand:- start:2902 stop:3258 length:357 start_codon:yes stop_codon:yes gene_type:complete
MKQIIERPWGHEEMIVHAPRYIIKKLFIKAGHSLLKQFHSKKDETVYILDGILCLDFSREKGESNIRKIFKGESWRIAPKTIHKLSASSDGDVVLFKVSTPEQDGTVKLFDDHSRSNA